MHLDFIKTPFTNNPSMQKYSGDLINKLPRSKYIEEKILRNEDIFGRGNKLKKIEIDGTYPEYIYQNKEKFLDWII